MKFLISWVRTAHTNRHMKANQQSVTNATYRVALGTCPPFEEGEIIKLVDIAIADKNFFDSDNNPVEYGKLFCTFSNGAVLSGSVFRGAHKTGTRKGDNIVVRSDLATAMAKAKAFASAKFPRPDKGQPDNHAKEFNTLAILSLLRELTKNDKLDENDNVSSIEFKVSSVFNCIGEVSGNAYQYTAYCLDLSK